MHVVVSLHSSRLNEDQLKVVKYALAQDSRPIAPLVVYGAFGTGKTEALAETARTLASIPDNRTRILICTHTNAYVWTFSALRSVAYVYQFGVNFLKSRYSHLKCLKMTIY